MNARVRFGAIVMILFGALLAPGPASAETAPTPEPLVESVSVTVEQYKPNGELISSKTQNNLTAKVYTGGSSSASGCQKVTVTKKGSTLLGFTAYRFHNWTSWCWTRTTQRVYNVTTNWYLSDFTSTYYWRGILKSEQLFYDYSTNDGHPTSAYKNYRMGTIENCVLKYGCIGIIYPVVLIRSYYNGTFAYEVGG